MKQSSLRPGGASWVADVERLRFFSKVLDRPAFRHFFHQELSFADFDQAMEDTVLAINTGYWRTRDGQVIERGQGKSHLVNPDWRSATDEVVRVIGTVRTTLRETLALTDMLLYSDRRFDRGRFDDFDDLFRQGEPLTRRIDDLRNTALGVMNDVLAEAGLNPLPLIGH